MLAKLKNMFSKSDKIKTFNEISAHRKYGIQVTQYIENGKYMIYVNDTFENDTVVDIFDDETEVEAFIDELAAEISNTAKNRKKDMENRLVKDLNILEYLHKRDFKHLFIHQYKKTMFSVYLNKKLVNHVNSHIEDKIFGETHANEV